MELKKKKKYCIQYFKQEKAMQRAERKFVDKIY